MKMTKHELESEGIAEIIRLWEGIAAGTEVDIGMTNNSSLCRYHLYYDCYDCPISQATGKRYCKDTPLQDWIMHHGEFHSTYILKNECPTCTLIAKKQVVFLKSLLPSKKGK